MSRMSRVALPVHLAGYLKYLLLAALLLAALPSFAAERILAARVWPAAEYTRVTFEAARAVKHEMFFLEDPARLVVDLDGVDFNDELKALPSKVGASDPYIAAVRVGLNRPNVVRVVFELRSEVKPFLFPLAPAGEYRHRLVLDLYPPEPADPLLALLQPRPDPIREIGAAPIVTAPAPAEVAKAEVPQLTVVKLEPVTRAASQPAKDRLVIVAIDAGHGGEDPGARGRHGTKEKDVTLAIARRLKAAIDAEPNMRAVMIRDGDYFIPLGQRVSKARRARADVFVSVHADAWVKPDVRGSSVFALSERGATTTAARWLAQRENQSDLILCDLDLPVMDGYQVAATLRASRGWREVPLVAFTADTTGSDRSTLLAAGFTGYIQKPPDPETFSAAVARYLPCGLPDRTRGPGRAGRRHRRCDSPPSTARRRRQS